MTFLRYPSGLGIKDRDYVSFTPFEYRSNSRGGNGPMADGASSVILYMPNSTPAVANANDWGAVNFPGPLGSLQRDIAGTVVGTVTTGTSVSDMVSQLTTGLSAATSSPNYAGAAKQFGLRMIPQQLLGATPNQLLAISRGQVYNPNVELAYTAPQMRAFSFSFDLIPNNAQEASIINQIILNFKKYSAPKNLDNGMFEIPMVWKVRYKTGQGDDKNMNQFKRAACTSVTVTANSQTDMHVAHDAGVPVSTSLQLTFQEVDIITRIDHELAGGQGY
jgi:hypothetical protein